MANQNERDRHFRICHLHVAICSLPVCFPVPSLSQLEALLAADPSDPFVLYAIAQEHAKANRHSLAVEFFDRCIAADAAYVYAYYHKGKVLLGQGDRAGALAAANAGLVKARAIAEAHAVGELLTLIDDIEEA